MRLLFVHECIGAQGGAESNVFQTAHALQRRGHAVGLLHGPGTGRNENVWAELFASRFPLNPGQSQSVTAAALQAFDPDAVYVHKMADLEVIEALVNSGRPLARMVHDHDLYCMRSYKYNYFTREICRRPATLYCVFPCGASVARNRNGAFPVKWVSYGAKKREIRLNRRFARMVVAGEYMKQELLRNGFDPARIEIHPPVPRFSVAPLQSSFSDRNLILYVGQIVRGKGVDVLIQSLAQVKAPFECVIVGEGSHRAYCEDLARACGMDKKVRFCGYVPSHELVRYYQECSVVAVSSVWPEPFGMVGLEAMFHGLPVVAFDAGSIREWLADGETGFLVPWMDRKLFALRTEQLLLDKPLARKLGESGRRVVADRFNFDTYISALESMFARVSGRTKGTVTA